MDFTLNTYKTLVHALLNQGFSFIPFGESYTCLQVKNIILRHDVDLLPLHSLKFARIQSTEGIKGSYYFRMVAESYDEAIIKDISALGHEIGYHYETMDTCKGDVDKAYDLFCVNLEKLRKIVPVTTICMHGSPLSRYDNRLIWQKYDYRKLGIIGEPYFDVDFNKVLYLTDTGRRWDGDSYNVRDRSLNKKDLETKRLSEEKESLRPSVTQSLSLSVTIEPPYRRTNAPFPRFHSTFDIIKAAQEGKLPYKIMMTFHPQRWTDKPIPWVKELVWQNAKNTAKYFLIKMRK